MSNIKILKENKKTVFMLTSLTIFSFIIFLFGITMLFSPIINQENLDKVNEFYNNDYTLVMSFLYKMNEYGVFAVKSDLLLIVWLPLIIGASFTLIMLFRIIIHSKGQKTKNRKGIPVIVKPIRSYQLTMVIGWFFLVVLFFTTIFSYLSASPFLFGATWFIGFSNSPFLTEESITHFSNVLNGQFKNCYWLTYGLFSQSTEGIYGENSEIFLWFWILFPIIFQFIFFLVAFIGTICGECSWGIINTSVIRDLDISSNESVQLNNNVSKKYIDKKIDLNKKTSSEIQARVLLFYKNFISLLESSNNTKIPIYNEARILLEKYSVIQKTNWKKIGKYVQEIVNWYTNTEQRFVNLLSQLVTNPKINYFKGMKNELQKLIGEYQSSINTWNLLKAEFKIEQIFILSSYKSEILAKVGYCLKNRLNTTFSSLDDKNNFIKLLEKYKFEKDYINYRKTCINLIKQISPEKIAINDFIKNISSLINFQ
ncbi:hypothetical protein [Spiroplasma turonicum]|uniref:Transmembrane protein n=1 Tax=Spiroplasma turonicum TaxID=216946 RepID=A0A0K1P751_9MOLU|nr:hypothetical protein [Spiroplasma turonicum]AKU79722.1 hypothetical protein STURON_00476 [Spiroplasma turonicum]ALX70740.1 hypothetical protein STURO_v1c04740 [Spiroplasma turonicum]